MFIVSRSNRVFVLGSAGNLVLKEAKVRLDKTHTRLKQGDDRYCERHRNSSHTYLPILERSILFLYEAAQGLGR